MVTYNANDVEASSTHQVLCHGAQWHTETKHTEIILMLYAL